VARTRTTGRREGGRGARDSVVHRQEGEERISSNLRMAKLGGRSPERGKTAMALGKIRREGEAPVGRRKRSRRRNGGEGGGARERGPERGR
jgi:hypothetical protein